MPRSFVRRNVAEAGRVLYKCCLVTIEDAGTDPRRVFVQRNVPPCGRPRGVYFEPEASIVYHLVSETPNAMIVTTPAGQDVTLGLLSTT